jgi:hypothetical protein
MALGTSSGGRGTAKVRERKVRWGVESRGIEWSKAVEEAIRVCESKFGNSLDGEVMRKASKNIAEVAKVYGIEVAEVIKVGREIYRRSKELRGSLGRFGWWNRLNFEEVFKELRDKKAMSRMTKEGEDEL